MFADPEGLGHELRVSNVEDEPLIAEQPDIPAEVALQGFYGARAYASNPEASRKLFEEALGFQPRDDGWEARGTAGAACTASTHLPPSADYRGRGASTTSPGHRRWTITRPGATG